MYILWVLTTATYLCRLVGCNNTNNQTNALNQAVQSAKSKLDQQAEVRPPLVSQKVCSHLALLSSVYRVTHHSNRKWQIERQITLLRRQAGGEQDESQKQKLQKELKALQEYDGVLRKNEKHDKKRLLDLLENDLNNLEKALKLLKDVKMLKTLQQRLPEFPRDACTRYNNLWQLKQAVDAIRYPNGQYDYQEKAKVEAYLREFSQYLVSFFVKEFLEFLIMQFETQKSYMDVARRALGVVDNANEFRSKLFNNEDLKVQSVLYRIHHMNLVETCDDEEINELLKKYPNENSVVVLKELIKKADSKHQEATEKDLKEKAKELGVEVTEKVQTQEQGEVEEPEETEEQQTQPQESEEAEQAGEQAEGSEAKTQEAEAAEEERLARENVEQSQGGQGDGKIGEESQQETAEGKGDAPVEPKPADAEEQQQQGYEQWGEDWPFERRCDPPCRILRLSEFMVRQGFGTMKYAENAIPVSGDYPYGGILLT